MMPVKHTFIFCMLLLGYASYAQQKNETDSVFNTTSKTFLPIPLIINNPTIKTGFGGLGLYFFKVNQKDIQSPPSLISLYAIYSTNKSYIFIPSGRFFWKENKNRASVSTGILRSNNAFDYSEEDKQFRLVFSEIRKFVSLEYSRKVIGDFYLGLLYLGTKTNYKFDQGTEEENDFAKEYFKQNGIEDNFVSSVGLNFSYDNRDYPYFPTKGFSGSIRPKLNADWLGSDNNYVDTDYEINFYHLLKENLIIAAGISGGFAFGDVPFDGYQNYGVRNSLRGYETGKYKGRNMIATQAELRWRFYKSFGAVFFAGTGSIWGNEQDGEEAFERNWLPSAGAGLRYMISKEKRINIRLDYAIGVDGNQGFYFGVMEAF